MELLVAMAVGGMLLTGLVVAIFQVFGINKEDSAKITALENIKSAAYSVMKDIKKADTTNLVSGGAVLDNVILDWTIWYDNNGNLIPAGNYYRCKYLRSGTNLLRKYGTYSPSSLPTPPIPDGSFTWEADKIVGRSIAGVEFSRSLVGNIITMSITASPVGQAQTEERKTYLFYLQDKEAAVR